MYCFRPTMHARFFQKMTQKYHTAISRKSLPPVGLFYILDSHPSPFGTATSRYRSSCAFRYRKEREFAYVLSVKRYLHHYGRGSRNAARTADAGTLQTRRAVGREISFGGYSHQQLPARRIQSDLPPDAVQHRIAPSAHSTGLPLRPLLGRFCGSFVGGTNRFE